MSIKIQNPLDVIVHQCTRCLYVSAHKQNVQRHIAAKCPGASVESGSVTMYPECMLTATTIDNSTNTNSHNVNINVNLIVPAGSAAEQTHLVSLFRDPDVLKELTTCPPEEIPAVLLRLSKGQDAPPHMRNIQVSGDRVNQVQRGGRVVSLPRSKFVKKTMGDMLEKCATATSNGDAQAGLQELQQELTQPQFACSKRKISMLEVARMEACSDPARYKLGREGREFITKTSAHVNRELDLLGPTILP